MHLAIIGVLSSTIVPTGVIAKTEKITEITLISGPQPAPATQAIQQQVPISNRPKEIQTSSNKPTPDSIQVPKALAREPISQPVLTSTRLDNASQSQLIPLSGSSTERPGITLSEGPDIEPVDAIQNHNEEVAINPNQADISINVAKSSTFTDGTPDQSSAREWLNQQLGPLIHYPKIAIGNDWQEIHQIEFNFSKEGRIVRFNILTNSKYPVLLKQTKRAIKRISKKQMDCCLEDTVSLVYEIRYEITE